LVVAVVVGAGPVRAGSGEESLYRKVLENLMRTRFEASGKVEGTAGGQLQLRFRHAQLDGRRTWIEITSPKEFQGQRWLIVDRDGGEGDKIWHYDPKAQKTAEVPKERWKEPWLGTAFVLEDFLLPDPNAYTFELGGEENVGGETFTVVRLTPKEKGADRFMVRVYSIDSRGNRLVRGLFFDQQGRAVGRWIVERTEQRSGEWFPAQLRVMDLSSQRSSVLTLADFKYEFEASPDAFETGGLVPRPTPSPK
jgi:hypothetical protein